MSIAKAYDEWAGQYDSNENKTRDLDRKATIEMLTGLNFQQVLEIGCGTGKNTEWLITRAKEIMAIDFSEGMLAKARQKINSNKVEFLLADLNSTWPVNDKQFDLVTCNLVLEHIKNLNSVFRQAYGKLKTGGIFFVSELHPFKQYLNTKARFENEEGIQELEVFQHHVSDFIQAALKNGFGIIQLNEWFDEPDETNIPRLITFLFEKGR